MIDVLTEMMAVQSEQLSAICEQLERLNARWGQAGGGVDFSDGPNAALDGTQNSGAADVRQNGARFGLLRSRRTLAVPGMATVHTHVTQNINLGGADRGATKMVMDVRWKTAAGGGNALVDCTRGQVFTIGGADSVEIDVYAEPIATGGSLDDLAQVKRVEAVVHWSTSVQPKPCWFTGQSIALVAGVPSTPLPIPLQAKRLSVLQQTPAAFGTLLADFTRLPGAGRVYIGNDAAANQIEVAAGAEWYQIQSTMNETVIPLWELAL